MAPTPRRPALSRIRRRPRLTLQTLEDRWVPATDITAIGTAFTIANSVGESATITFDRSSLNYTLSIAGSTLTNSGGNPNVTITGGGTGATILAYADTRNVVSMRCLPEGSGHKR